MLTLKANPKQPGDWKERHNAAVQSVLYYGPPDEIERCVVLLLKSWAAYADAVNEAGEALHNAVILPPGWAQVGRGLLSLLSSDLGPRLDRGTLEAFIHDTMTMYGAPMVPGEGDGR